MRSVVFLTAAAVCALSACQRGSAPASTEAAEPRLVFEDDFEREAFGEHWSTEAPDAWSIDEGWVAVAGARNAGLWLDVELPENVRIEFLAKSLSEEGDIKFEVFTDGRTHESGYVGIFGGWNNRLNIIARLDEHGDDRLVGAEGQRVEPERVYRFRIERTGDALEWFVDGEPFLTYEDASPLRGAGHAHFGFNDWDAPLRFDELRIWDLGS